MLTQQASTSTAQSGAPRIMQTAFSFAPLFIVHTAIQLHVFDQLANGGQTAATLQTACNTSKRGMDALLDALVGLGWLEKEGPLYRLNKNSERFFVRSKPSYVGAIFQHFVSDILPVFQELEEVVRSGKPARARNQQAEGGAFFRNFVSALFPIAYPAAKALASRIPLDTWGKGAKVLDVAAGSGVWGIAIAEANQNVSVTAVDWPEVLPVTRQTADRFGVGGRYQYIGGDLDQVEFGRDYALAILGNILHSEGDLRSEQLLRKTWQSLAPGGTVAIAEFLMDGNRIAPLPAVLFNINMLVNTEQGRVYSFAEIERWLKGSGFSNVRLLEIPCSSPLILADK